MTALIDWNGLKAMDETACGKVMGPVAARWESFGWHTREVDGHDMTQLCDALDWAEADTEAPCAIIAHTVKGKGVSFLEGRPEFHNAALTPEQITAALAELEATLQALREA